ncbi:MAG: 4Fe-4S dicluster domain-containing protein [Deltaproteobacteria bacterium]|nr:4Fe-4S dicluster domain-containing protein [Deltaproteobacteria bacterium]MBW2218665.1 4Fe-4S dicluster domain-containing protein [Deltaproteobacteria bacterium]
MKWSGEAENAIRKVPFFVRKKVRARVEKEAAAEGRKGVTTTEVNATRARFLSGMDSEIKGFQVDNCFGQSGCPNKAVSVELLLPKIEQLLEKEDILGFLRQNVKGDLKFHHEFRISLAECPNACSQPQIKDIGIIGSAKPKIADEPCSLCEACIEACREDAIIVDKEKEAPAIDFGLCLGCGKCIESCPTGTICEGEKGFRVQLGGKLGRHPKLASELAGTFSEDEVLKIVKQCISFYKKNSKAGKRFADIYKGHKSPDFLKLN